MRSALDSLTVAAPDWLVTHIQADWFDRYSRRVENYRLPKLDKEREALASTMGGDGLALLEAIYAPNTVRLSPKPGKLTVVPGAHTCRNAT